MNEALYIGVDVGTSGCRAVAIRADGSEAASARTPIPAPLRRGAAVEQAPELWWEALSRTLKLLCQSIDSACVVALALDGTSGSVLLGDAMGQPIGPALMYNDARALDEARQITAVAPASSAAHGTASGLAKLLWLRKHTCTTARVFTQADWLSGRLLGSFSSSDTNNVLKLGFDPITGTWPTWLESLGVPRDSLPQVVTPGTCLGNIQRNLADEFDLPPTTRIVAGTTDSTAAFIATGAALPGEAVTSLGSTLVLKVISDTPVWAPEYGVYSQPLGNRWLVGGGSNSGGAVLRQFFNDAAMAELSAKIVPGHATGLDYYPLPAPGERFPINDPALPPRLEPRPADDVRFFQALLEGIAAIEERGYRLLAELGAPYPLSIRSVGGGAENHAWTAIRTRYLGVPVLLPEHTEAAYGSALLALQGSRAISNAHRPEGRGPTNPTV